jgi:predicted nucleotidyltransferase
MRITNFDDINHLLEELVLQLKTILTDNCLGVYLYGSLVWGDFNYNSSDIDILVIVQNDISPNEFSELDKLHNLIAQEFPFWNDRLEIAYIAKDTLQNIKSKSGKVAIISPGEKFNIKDTGTDWLINCYLLQNMSKILFGPKPELIIEPITKEEFLQSVKQQALEWRDWISHTKDSTAYQYYAVITICRAFYVLRNGEQTSKIVAAKWVAQNYPQWKNLIEQAIAKEEVESAYAQVYDFVNEVTALIEGKSI